MKDKKLVLVRQDEDGNKLLSWYPIVFGQLSHKPIKYGDGVTAYERINENALSNADMSNVKAVVHHDTTKILGRSSAGTLKLEVDEYGLLATVNMGTTQLHKDTLEQVERGDLFEGSFVGTCTSYSDLHMGETPVREIMVINVLKDVSIVTDAAYKGAIILKRSENNNSETMTEEEKKAKAEELKRSQEAAEKAEKDKLELERKLADEQAAKVKAEKEAAKANAELKRKEEAEKVAEELRRQAAKEDDGSYLNLVRSAVETGGTIELERAAGDGTTTTEAKMIPLSVAQLSIKGKEPIWDRLNTDHHPNMVGTRTLPYRSPKVGQAVAERAALTRDTVSPQGNILTPKRFGHTFEITVETLAAAGDAYFQKLLVDGMKAADRAFDTYIYEKLLAGATTVPEAADITNVALDALDGAIDSDGESVAISTKKTFYAAKGTKLDAGSGLFLAKKTGENTGETHDGLKWLWSTNFADPANEQYIVVGDMSAALATADWNKTELIVDRITGAKSGIIYVTVNKIMDAALANPLVVVKSADLDDAA